MDDPVCPVCGELVFGVSLTHKPPPQPPGYKIPEPGTREGKSLLCLPVENPFRQVRISMHTFLLLFSMHTLLLLPLPPLDAH